MRRKKQILFIKAVTSCRYSQEAPLKTDFGSKKISTLSREQAIPLKSNLKMVMDL